MRIVVLLCAWTVLVMAQNPLAKKTDPFVEKRNHPKNVRDPMIVLDGQTFVTAYNKPPWQGRSVLTTSAWADIFQRTF